MVVKFIMSVLVKYSNITVLSFLLPQLYWNAYTEGKRITNTFFNYKYYKSFLSFFPVPTVLTVPQSLSDAGFLDFDTVEDYGLTRVFWINVLPLSSQWWNCLGRCGSDSGKNICQWHDNTNECDNSETWKVESL
jgi:hypothetical protein